MDGHEDLSPQPQFAAGWIETNCGDNNQRRRIGNENYMLSADGLLMPTRKDQAPPDLKYFRRGQR